MLIQAASVALIVSAFADEPLARYEYRRSVMGTEARIVLYAPTEAAAKRAARLAFAEMLQVETVASDWIASSELSRLGARSGGKPMAISASLFDVLDRAVEIAALTDGAFDPTVGPLTHLWRQHRKAQTMPSPAALATARDLVGWHDLELNREARTARLKRAGMRLDLGGIAKGYACDVALTSLEKSGLSSALVEIGGDLVAGEAPPDRKGWRIRVDCGDGKPSRDFLLLEQAVATSGDSYQHVEIGGMRYSHVLDPRTGLGIQAGLCTSVIALDGATADALASAVNVVGYPGGKAIVSRIPGARVLAR